MSWIILMFLQLLKLCRKNEIVGFFIMEQNLKCASTSQSSALRVQHWFTVSFTCAAVSHNTLVPHYKHISVFLAGWEPPYVCSPLQSKRGAHRSAVHKIYSGRPDAGSKNEAEKRKRAIKFERRKVDRITEARVWKENVLFCFYLLF